MITVNKIVYNYCELQNELAAPVLTGVVLFILKLSSIQIKKSNDFHHHSSISPCITTIFTFESLVNLLTK